VRDLLVSLLLVVLERNRRVAAALQQAALARRSAQANVEAVLAWWGVPRADRRRRARAALETLGALHLAERRAAALSGGEARRVHLARVLALAPGVLLLSVTANVELACGPYRITATIPAETVALLDLHPGAPGAALISPASVVVDASRPRATDQSATPIITSDALITATTS
jgi:ABC transporter